MEVSPPARRIRRSSFACSLRSTSRAFAHASVFSPVPYLHSSQFSVVLQPQSKSPLSSSWTPVHTHASGPSLAGAKGVVQSLGNPLSFARLELRKVGAVDISELPPFLQIASSPIRTCTVANGGHPVGIPGNGAPVRHHHGGRLASGSMYPQQLGHPVPNCPAVPKSNAVIPDPVHYLGEDGELWKPLRLFGPSFFQLPRFPDAARISV